MGWRRLVAATTLVPAALGAQATEPARATMVWLDAGGARVQQPTSTLRTAGTIGGGVWHARGRLALAAEGSVTLASDSVSAGQYVGRVTMVPWAFARTEVDVSATTNGVSLPSGNGTRAIAARQHLQLGPFEVSALAGVGRTTRVITRLPTHRTGHRLGGALAWQRSTRLGVLRAGGQYLRGWTDDFQLMEASGIVLGEIASSYAVADRQLDVAWQRGPLWLQVSRAWRVGTGKTVGTASGLHVAAAWSVSGSTTLIAQAGEQLADVVRGVPQARYSGVAVRWNPIRPRALRRDARALADERGGTLPVAAVPDLRGDEVLVRRREGHGDVTIRIEAPAGAVVEVATSATGWAPTPAMRDGDRWVYRFSLPSGTHRVALRVSGARWRAPRGLAVVDDDFGGQAGLIVIP